jgi:large subunit ribosomal protein L10
VPSQEKKEKVKQIKKWFDKTDSLLVLHYKGLTVAEANELRVRLTGAGSELRVLKNTLTRIAVADTPAEGITPLLDGPVGVVFIKEDSAGVAKTLRDFARGRDEFYLTGGLLDGRVLDAKQVDTFATLPPREVLLAQMAGMMQAPLARIVGAVVAPARKMLGLFQALADKKAVTEEAAVPVIQETPGIEEPAEQPPEEEQPSKAEETAVEPEAATAESTTEDATAESTTEDAPAVPEEAEGPAPEEA